MWTRTALRPRAVEEFKRDNSSESRVTHVSGLVGWVQPEPTLAVSGRPLLTELLVLAVA